MAEVSFLRRRVVQLFTLDDRVVEGKFPKVQNPGTHGRDRPRTNSVARWIIAVGRALLWFVLAVLSLWATAALYIDLREPILRVPLAIGYAAIVALLCVKHKLS